MYIHNVTVLEENASTVVYLFTQWWIQLGDMSTVVQTWLRPAIAIAFVSWECIVVVLYVSIRKSTCGPSRATCIHVCLWCTGWCSDVARVRSSSYCPVIISGDCSGILDTEVSVACDVSPLSLSLFFLHTHTLLSLSPTHPVLRLSARSQSVALSSQRQTMHLPSHFKGSQTYSSPLVTT